MATITDGASNTYLLGEKFLNTDMYTSGQNYGDNGPCYTGQDKDIARLATDVYVPAHDYDCGGNMDCNDFAFGSAHADIWNACFCDGSVHPMGFWIDPQIHLALGGRADGLLVDPSKF